MSNFTICSTRSALSSTALRRELVEIEWHRRHYCGRGLMKYLEPSHNLAKELLIPAATLEKTFRVYSCWELIISAADYISWRCVSGPGPCIYPVAALILLYHLFMYSESRLFDICLGCSFLFSRTVRAHCSPQFFYRELRWAVLLISVIKNNNSLTYAQSIL